VDYLPSRRLECEVGRGSTTRNPPKKGKKGGGRKGNSSGSGNGDTGEKGIGEYYLEKTPVGTQRSFGGKKGVGTVLGRLKGS